MKEEWFCDLCGELSVVDVSIETDGTVCCGICAAELTLDAADVFEIALGRCKKAEERECNHSSQVYLEEVIARKNERISSLEKQVYQGKALLTRYRDEVPLGHQPHMIAHVVDGYLGEGE